jgi:creatinine amidohydrolase
MKSKVNILELSQPEVEKLLKKTDIVVVPNGSIEQHGPHLPMGTDYFNGLNAGRRVAEKMNCLFVPFSPIGVSPYHSHWKGSLTIGALTFINYFQDVCESLIAHGARRFVIMNGHEGNIAPVTIGATNIQMKYKNVRFFVISWWVVANQIFGDRMLAYHAGRQETVGVMAYNPKLVDAGKATNPSPAKQAHKMHELFRNPGARPVLRDFREVALTGWYGHPETVTEKEAKEIIEKTTDHIVKLVKEEFRRKLPK